MMKVRFLEVPIMEQLWNAGHRSAQEEAPNARDGAQP